MNRVTKRIGSGTGTIFLAVFSMSALTNDTAAKAASAVLPLPESLRAGATAVSRDGGKFTVLKKGSNQMVCIREPEEGTGRHYQNGKIFWAECFDEKIFAAMKREDELAAELRSQGKTPTAKILDDALDSEIKAGKLKLPDHPTLGFQMLGPIAGFNSAANSVSHEIKAWQMVIIPYSTGASLSLPEARAEGMPWVMDSGTWMSHIMV